MIRRNEVVESAGKDRLGAGFPRRPHQCCPRRHRYNFGLLLRWLAALLCALAAAFFRTRVIPKSRSNRVLHGRPTCIAVPSSTSTWLPSDAPSDGVMWPG